MALTNALRNIADQEIRQQTEENYLWQLPLIETLPLVGESVEAAARSEEFAQLSAGFDPAKRDLYRKTFNSDIQLRRKSPPSVQDFRPANMTVTEFSQQVEVRRRELRVIWQAN